MAFDRMAKISVGAIVLCVCAALFFAGAFELRAEQRRYRKLSVGLTPLRIPILDGQNNRLNASFEAVWDEPHYVALEFTTDSGDPGVDSLMSAGSKDVGSMLPQQAHYDFDWEIFDGARLVGEGSGRHRATGAFGSGPTQGLEFGEARLHSGRQYRIAVSFGPGFRSLLRARPVLEVGVARPGPSIGLEWVRALAGPLSVACTVIGSALLIAALALHLRRGEQPGT